MSDINPFNSAEIFAKLEKEMAWANSYDRLPTLLEFAPFCESADWFRALGEAWAVCDNIGIYADDLIEAIRLHNYLEAYPIKEMMNAEELEAFNKLPEVLTVYRGCYAVNKWGFCWSLERSIAESFPFLNRYRAEGRPLLVKATLRKSQVAALKLDREEAEIVTFERPKCISISTARSAKEVQP